jgi:formylglycine-generating enzyme required for sulfatase activity
VKFGETKKISIFQYSNSNDMPQDLPDTYLHPLPNGLYYNMVRVRPGLFVMGSNGKDANYDEKPEHLVSITQDYYIGAYPVTQAIWKAVMNGYNPSKFKGDDRPVEQVSWHDIVEGGQDEKVPVGFLPLLNKQYSVEDEELKNLVFRLPTEAEWEYAVKDGHLRALGEIEAIPNTEIGYTTYSGSDQLKEVGWYYLNSHIETKAVGKQRPNMLGLFDMSGNTYDWCQDTFDKDYYTYCKQSGIVRNPIRKSGNDYCVVRGGSWLFLAEDCRATSRHLWPPKNRDDFVGFRLVLAPEL